ncbi:winged helix-turn-helix domain-containing protein [Intestinibacter sp.]
MKKKIEFISLTSSLGNWLLEKLKASPVEIGDVSEFKEGIESLLDGTNNTLMLEIDDDVVYEDYSFDVMQFGELLIKPKERRVLRENKDISLTPKEYDILLFLAKNRGEVLTKEQIYKAVWDEEYLLDDSNIMAFIRKLRKKIEPNPDAPIYILTIWGIGYKFNDNL